ncbi:type II toxin-antitoxin system mRNA interferase toxin, RelE/StbE family [bacterium]|nr:type II toxin-antitoxin system mRNA interferase toxin, RelE/StbE family [bacterium]
MGWRIEWDERALKDMHQIDRADQKTIIRYLRERIETNENPRRFGKPLICEKKGLWRYRIGCYRIICKIEEFDNVVFVIGVGHRKDIYE